MAKITAREQKWYGWRRSLPDFRDRRFAIPHRFQLVSELPPAADVSHLCPAAVEQGNLGSCVAHGVIWAMRADNRSQARPDEPLSRLQLYYDGREAEGTISSDSGLEVRTAIRCAKRGVAPESLWNYDIKRFRQRPPPPVYIAAKINAALQYQSVDLTEHAIKAALASGHVVIFGISIYTSFESKAVDQTGIIQTPIPGEKQIGGHCMILTGYDDKADPTRVRGRNSWGRDWGQSGDFTIPWTYVTNRQIADDFWIITTVGAGT